MRPDELLDRVAVTLRTEIGPAVSGEFPRTQAFMAAVVIERIARGLRAADDTLAQQELSELTADLDRLGAFDVDAVRNAALAATDDAGLVALVQAIYSSCEELGQERSDSALQRVRTTLRVRIDRRVEVAR